MTSPRTPPRTPPRTYAIARLASSAGPRLDLQSFARAAGLHPDLVRRLVTLGLLEAAEDSAGTVWFTPAQLIRVARIQRLRAGLALNYAAVGLVIDLLDRIAELEAAGQRRRNPPGHTGGR